MSKVKVIIGIIVVGFLVGFLLYYSLSCSPKDDYLPPSPRPPKPIPVPTPDDTDVIPDLEFAHSGVVLSVISGDRILVRMDRPRLPIVRRWTVAIFGIEAPVEGQPGFEDAVRVCENLVLNQKVEMAMMSLIEKKVAIVRVGYMDVGRELVRQGWAIATDETYSDEQTQAQRERIGVWQQ